LAFVIAFVIDQFGDRRFGQRHAGADGARHRRSPVRKT
jgi:hypothetical protein